jgi:integrase
MAHSPQAAQREAEAMAQAAISGALTVAEMITAYQDAQRDRGNRERGIQTTGHALCRFFAPLLDDQLSALTTTRCAARYEELRKQLAVDTHRNYLSQAKTCLNWAVEQRLLRSNPLAAVKGIGRRRHGKQQLRIDEGRKLKAVCLRAGAAGDDGAVAVLLALLCGLRASEITTRTVRDLDDGGRRLWVEENPELRFETKTDASRRPVPVPTELQPLLLRRCKDKLPGALLFPAETGGPHWRDWPREQAKRLCEQAGVQEVCAHSLRGFVATAAIEAGAVPELVARLLGHEETATTLRSYAVPGSFEAQEWGRGLAVLNGSNLT